jgi:hypothetical protein
VDLDGADLTVRRFGDEHPVAPALCEHGSFSASLLVGQSTARLRGVVPHVLWPFCSRCVVS